MFRLRPPSDVKVTYRLGFISSAFLLTIAAAADAAQFLLSLTVIGEVVSELLGVLVDILLLGIAWMMGVRYKGSKLLTALAGFALEIIPFVNDLPGFSGQALALILLTRSDDIEEAVKKDRAQKEKQRAAMAAQARYARSRSLRAGPEYPIPAPANDSEEEEERAAA